MRYLIRPVASLQELAQAEEVETAAKRLSALEIGLGASGTERGFYLHLGYSGRARLRKQLPRSSAGERPAQEWHRELAQLRERRDRRLAERVS